MSVAVEIDPELVNRIAATLEEYTEEHDHTVRNIDVVAALYYVSACVQRIGIKDKELH